MGFLSFLVFPFLYFFQPIYHDQLDLTMVNFKVTVGICTKTEQKVQAYFQFESNERFTLSFADELNQNLMS